MHIEPDAAGAALDREALGRRILGTLHRTGLFTPQVQAEGVASREHEGSALSTRPTTIPTTSELTHPAVIEVAHTAQHAARAGSLTALRRSELATALGQAWNRSTPATALGGQSWSVEAAGPQPHLERAVTRALANVPETSSGPTGDAAVVPWTDSERQVLGEAAGLLRNVWPAMLDELTWTVRQVVLLRGTAIEGFTDFTVHGALFLHRNRLAPGPSRSDGPLELAEALVHEGTHQRCNAALVSTPLWSRAAEQAGSLRTPLRADPRPLGGLFHQMVVLSRSAAFYQRLLDTAARPAVDNDVLRDRHRQCLNDAVQAATTLSSYRSSLTGAGRDLLAQVAAKDSV
ncbi:aKG-HExxH-type peptide beta-hydroxylase [Streptomyces sp. NPDC058620]|uniref:aKG-HExxH-type peptide beta-hydroxylase n=1 Tax=Streptomyces sp. NPDC058620 TaxID=3346560 RepID=UPI00365E4F91